jgi:hypothetical protein
MSPTIRILISFVLLAIVAFCSFSFLATFEPPGFIGWRIVYGVAIMLSSIGIIRLIFAKRQRAQPVGR